MVWPVLLVPSRGVSLHLPWIVLPSHASGLVVCMDYFRASHTFSLSTHFPVRDQAQRVSRLAAAMATKPVIDIPKCKLATKRPLP
jgi:hypothetical protein